RALAGDANVGQQRDRQAGADRRPIDGGDHWLSTANEVLYDRLVMVHCFGDRRSISHLGRPKIAAGRKGATGTGNQGHVDLRVAIKVEPDSSKFIMTCRIAGVELLRPV